jgi:glycosyltransferase involved in cell wall biosynthesis
MDSIPVATDLPFEPLAGFAGMLRGEEERAACRGKRIGILIVAYNALTTLTRVLKRISPEVWANVEEIAVFDDASQDATYEVAVGLKALRNLSKLHVLRHEKNKGYGGNQKAGYRYFMDRGFDIVVLLHGDGQYAPEILSHMYEPLVQGRAEAVFGSRMMKTYGGPLKGGMPLYKYVGNRILSTFENAALGMSLTEFHSGYRAYDLHALRQVDFSRMTDDFHFDTEIIIKLNHQRMRILEVPIPTYYGQEICYVNGMRYAKDVARAVYRYKQSCRSARAFPEFEEYFVNYGYKRSKYSSHWYAQRMVRKDARVLDLGGGNGYFAAELKREGRRTITGVDGIEAPEREDAFDEYLRYDLDGPLDGLRERLRGRRFDAILLLDVLEHLRDPAALLSACRDWMERGGVTVVSVPNVAHLWIRLMLLCGRFDYSSRGILDRTHVRMFTRRSIRALAREAGFRIAGERATVVPLEFVTGLEPENRLLRLLAFFSAVLKRLRPTLFGYQFILELADGDQRR